MVWPTLGSRKAKEQNRTFSQCDGRTDGNTTAHTQRSYIQWLVVKHLTGFRVLAALLQGTLVVGVSQTLRRSTEGAAYIRQGGHHVGHWPTF